LLLPFLQRTIVLLVFRMASMGPSAHRQHLRLGKTQLVRS
jgi:hypothetical protein